MPGPHNQLDRAAYQGHLPKISKHAKILTAAAHLLLRNPICRIHGRHGCQTGKGPWSCRTPRPARFAAETSSMIKIATLGDCSKLNKPLQNSIFCSGSLISLAHKHKKTPPPVSSFSSVEEKKNSPWRSRTAETIPKHISSHGQPR